MIPKKDINQHQPHKKAELSRERCNKSFLCCPLPMVSGSIPSPAQAWAVVSRVQLWDPQRASVSRVLLGLYYLDMSH